MIYIASKSQHGRRWRTLRADGLPIISSWIDECDSGATADWETLWRRSFDEVGRASCLLLYAEPGEVLRGALLEAGAALARGIPVVYVGPADIGNILRVPGVIHSDTMDGALALAGQIIAGHPARQVAESALPRSTHPS
jgi:hypothetical protein